MGPSFTVLSPTFSVVSTTTSSSYVTVTASSSTDTENSDDEIVYCIDDSASEGAFSLVSEDEFVTVLSRPVSPRLRRLSPSKPCCLNSPNIVQLTLDVQGLTLTEPVTEPDHSASSGPTTASDTAFESPAATRPVPLTPFVTSPKKSKPRKRQRQKKAKKAAPTAAKSDSGSSDRGTGETYNEAVKYIDIFLSNPEVKEYAVCRLTFLQALIIELGLATTTSPLPASLKAATAFLKARVFINIREYLAIRGQGLDALKRIMHPNRKALVKSIQKKKNTMPLKFVKAKGLNVLLVQAHYH